MEEVISEIEKGCIEDREKQLREFEERKANSRHPHLETFNFDQHVSFDNCVGKKCPKCNEFYISSCNFAPFVKDGSKEVIHACNSKNPKREREREREHSQLFQISQYQIH